MFRQKGSGINLSNIRQSGRVRKTVDYTFSEFDQEIFDAVDRDGRRKGEATTHGTRQSKRRRMLYNDSDSDSNYDPGSPMVGPQIPKRPERHVYLRRHENDVENGNSDDVEEDKQGDVLKGEVNDERAGNDTALPRDDVVYDGASLEYNKPSNTNSDTVGAGSNQNVDSGSMSDHDITKLINQSSEDQTDSVNTNSQTDYTSSVENNKLSDKNLDTVGNGSSQTIDTSSVDKLNNQIPADDEKVSVHTTIQADDSGTSSRIEHNSSINISLVSDQDMLSPTPNLTSEDTSKSSINNAQVQTSTETSRNGDNIVNGKECTQVESNCNMLNSRDINLLTQENEQADSIQKNPGHLYGSQTIA